MSLGISRTGPTRPTDPGQSGQRVGGSDGSGAAKPAFPVEELQHADARVSTTSGATEVSQTTAAPRTKAPDAPTSQPTIARKMNIGDVADMLVNIQKAPTAENKTILSTIIKYGLEASGDNFNNISQLIQGRTQNNAIESSVISTLKGLATSPKSVDLISKFLNNQTQMGPSLAQLQQSLQQFSAALESLKNVMTPALYGGLSDILAQLDKNLKKLAQLSDSREMALTLVNQGKVIKDFHLFAGFIAGLQDKLKETNGKASGVLEKSIGALKESIGQLIENLVSQSVISKSSAGHNIGFDEFSYWQVPNPFGRANSSIDILIKRDPHASKKNQPFNTEKTKIVVKCETEDIGELAIIVEITGKKVWYMFYTENPQTKALILQNSADLKTKLAAQDYDLVGLRTLPQKVNIKKMLLPTINLDRLSKINAEI